MKLLKPRALRPGGRLGIIACSTPINAAPDVIDRAYRRLGELGFQVVEAPNARAQLGHTAGSIRERVKALHAFIRDPKIDGILAFWGGFQGHQLLEYLDYDLIRRNPKPIIGYSDMTSLLVAIHEKAGLVSFNGPAGITFGKPELPEFTRKSFEEVLVRGLTPLSLSSSSEISDNLWFLEPDKKMHFQKNPGWKVFRPGKAEGRLIGGNIGTMLLLAGTDYWPKLKGRIFVIEEDESENSRTLDRFFTQLRQMGVYDEIAGMIVGRFSSSVKLSPSDSLDMILDDALRGYRFPVITEIDFGHTDPLLTLPMGVRARMSTKPLKIELLEAAVS